MNFEQIKSFISIAETGSYTKSAKARFISQPAITNQMKCLEEELGTSLFIRNGKNILLSESGKKFLKYANRLISIEQDIAYSVTEKPNHYGIMDIAVPFLTMNEQMDSFLVKAVSEYGDQVTYRIAERNDTDIPEMVLNGRMELGVANHIVQHKDLVYEEAFTEEICLITPNREKYRNLNKEQLRKLVLEEKHVRYDFGEGTDFLWNDFFGKVIGEDLHNIKTAACTEKYFQQMALVEAGLGIGFISSICMQKKYREGKILAYRCQGLLQKPHYVVYNRMRAEEVELIRKTKDILVSELKKSLVHPELSF